MKNLIRKNQLMISALAVMLAIAGYLQFSGKSTEKEKTDSTSEVSQVSSDKTIVQEYVFDEMPDDIISQSSIEEVDMLDAGDISPFLEDSLQEAIPQAGEIPGETIFSSENGVTVLAEAKLLKEQVRAKNKEMLMEIVNNSEVADAEKQIAINSIVAMTDFAEKEAAAQILLEAKGFEGSVVSINSDGADVVVNALELTPEQLVQIEDILIRKTGVPAEKIVISTLVP